MFAGQNDEFLSVLPVEGMAAFEGSGSSAELTPINGEVSLFSVRTYRLNTLVIK